MAALAIAWGITRELRTVTVTKTQTVLVPMAQSVPILRMVSVPIAIAGPAEAPAWDASYPAISTDGRKIAYASYVENELGEITGREIFVVDVKTKKVVEQLPEATALCGFRKLGTFADPMRVEWGNDDGGPAREHTFRIFDGDKLRLEDDLAVAGDAYGMRGAAMHRPELYYDAKLRIVYGALAIGDGHGPGVTEYYIRKLP